jgi:hypothetical protein
MNLIFDIETDGLYNDVTQIHCIGVYDLDSDQTYVFNDQGNLNPISRGVQLLEDAECLIGHNIIGYDFPVIKKIYPWFTPKGQPVDTLILSHLYYTDMLERDKRRRPSHMPLQLYGRHSLEAYGYRLGEYKGAFGKTTDWKEWSQDMEDYMVQDIKVTTKLWNHFQRKLTQSK